MAIYAKAAAEVTAQLSAEEREKVNDFVEDCLRRRRKSKYIFLLGWY